jgi:hypothetical protein
MDSCCVQNELQESNHCVIRDVNTETPHCNDGIQENGH